MTHPAVLGGHGPGGCPYIPRHTRNLVHTTLIPLLAKRDWDGRQMTAAWLIKKTFGFGPGAGSSRLHRASA